MQGRRTQTDRRAVTKARLVSAARKLFAEKGYAATSTPEVAAAAGMTRGALYHHFADKTDLFRTVVEEEHLILAMSIEAAAAGSDDEPGPVKALLQGGDAFLTAMQDPGRRRILLVDAPAVLGRDELDAIDARHGLRTLIEGFGAAMDAKAIRELPLEPLARLVGAMFDRAAMADEATMPDYRKAMRALIRGLKT